MTLYAKENPATTGGIFLEARPSCECPELSLTVDELPDYLRAQEVARNMEGIDFDLPAVIEQARNLAAAPADL